MGNWWIQAHSISLIGQKVIHLSQFSGNLEALLKSPEMSRIHFEDSFLIFIIEHPCPFASVLQRWPFRGSQTGNTYLFRPLKGRLPLSAHPRWVPHLFSNLRSGTTVFLKNSGNSRGSKIGMKWRFGAPCSETDFKMVEAIFWAVKIDFFRDLIFLSWQKKGYVLGFLC